MLVRQKEEEHRMCAQLQLSDVFISNTHNPCCSKCLQQRVVLFFVFFNLQAIGIAHNAEQ